MESFKVVVILVSAMNVLAKTNDSTLVDKCFRPKNMCDLDTHTCIRDKPQHISDCAFVHGSGIVRKVDQPRHFWISIRDENKKYYPDSITYSVYRYTKNEDVAGSSPLKPIPGCCNLNLTDKTCYLPKYQEEEDLVAFASIATAVTDKYWYCGWPIEEYDAYERFCDNDQDNEEPCIEFKDGFPRMRLYFKPVSIQDMHFLKADYCFFSAPANIATRVREEGEINFSHEKYFPTSKIASKCSRVSQNKERIHELVKRHTNLPQKGVICYYILLPSYNIKWQNLFRCYIAELDDENNRIIISTPYLPVIIGAFVCLLVAIVVYSVGYRRRKGRIRKNLEKGVPSSVITATNEYFDDDKTSQNTSTTPDGSSNEVYFSIEYEIVQETDASAESEEVLSEAELIENSEYQWSNDVSPKGEKGVYCNKFDMLSYIRVRQDVNSVN